MNGFHKAVTHFICAHLRLKIIGRHLRRVDKNPVFARIWRFHTAVKEKCHMGIFFRLGNTSLSHTVFCQIFTKGFIDRNFVEGNEFVRNRHIIFGKADIDHICPFSPVKAGKIIAAEGAGQFSRPVRPEVKEDNGIFVIDRSRRCPILHNDCRNHEFIGNALCIGICHCLHCIFSRLTDTAANRIISLLYPFPTVISVHRIITSGNGSNLTNTDFFHFFCKLCHIIFTGSRRCVTSVQETMHINLFQAFAFCQL